MTQSSVQLKRKTRDKTNRASETLCARVTPQVRFEVEQICLGTGFTPSSYLASIIEQELARSRLADAESQEAA